MSDGPVARYDFLSYARRGAAADLTNADPLTGPIADRGPLTLKLVLQSSDNGSTLLDTLSQPVLLRGPGDVVGIDPRHVVRTDPPDRTFNYEPNYLAGIEFDHPDFLWLFTPAAANGDRLRPWVSLVVLADGEYMFPNTAPVPLPSIDVADASKLPPLDGSWAWAHVQIAGQAAPADLAGIFEREPQRCLSRLLCPRQLAPKTNYTAFLVPAFETGRLAGLGQDVPEGGPTAPAWTGAGTVTLPYYYRFSFRTSELGDFESLVRLLQPRRLDKRVGIRPMDVEDPGWNVPPGHGPVGLMGALHTVDYDTSLDVPVDPAFVAAVTAYVNRGAATLPDDSGQDPIVEPPLYGRWQAAVTSVDPAGSGWINELNTDPRHRATAGFGTRVVLDQREHLMTSAWRQVAGILRANQMLRQAQLARAGSGRLFADHVDPADDAVLLPLTSAVHQRILASPTTVAATVGRTRLPSSALSPVFRRATRPLGPVRARQGAPSTTGTLVRGLASGELRPEPAPRPPGGLTSLEQISDRFYPPWLPSWLRGVLGAPPWLLVLIAAALVLLLIVLGFLFAFFALALAIAGVVVAALAAALALQSAPRWRTAEQMRTERITPTAIAGQPPRPGFVLAVPGQPEPQPAAGPPGVDSPDAAAFRAAAMSAAAELQSKSPEPPTPPEADLPALAGVLRAQLDPEQTIPARIGPLIKLSGPLAQRANADDALSEILAAPEFPQPMYRPLADLSQDYLLPGLDKVPPNTLGLLVENHKFIEAYFAGLIHEMSRQLLWNVYPGDGRGSYFRQFWDVSGYVPDASDPQDPTLLRKKLEDIPPIHRWPLDNDLGDNPNRPETGDGNLVLLVRGELLRRYPSCIVYACKARWDAAKGRHELTETELHHLYRGTLLPDVTFFGFALKPDAARGSSSRTDPNQGWFIVLEQHSSEPRFGLEPAPGGGAQQVQEWNDLSWANFGLPAFLPADNQPQPPVIPTLKPPPPQTPDNPGDPDNRWGKDSAQTAFILLRRPVRVAVHASLMLPPAVAAP